MEDPLSAMGEQNQHLFMAMKSFIKEELDTRLDKVDGAMIAMAEATDKGLKEIRKEISL